MIAKNVPLMVQMQICTFFNPELTWRQQLTPIIGKKCKNQSKEYYKQSSKVNSF